MNSKGKQVSKSSQAAANNRANQMNPNNAAYQASHQGSGASKPALDNRSNQLNPNHAQTKASPPAANESREHPADGKK